MKNIKVTTIIGTAFLLFSAPTFADRDHNDDRHNRGFSFALIGDGPYGTAVEVQYDHMIRDINADQDVKFVIHTGDIKSGGERCDDALLIHRFEQYQTIEKPFVYTPGDNEWTDCHRSSNGSYLPTERLDYIRKLFFPTPGWTTGGKPMRVATQASMKGYEEFVENTLFTKSDVIFSQIHIVGSNNNLAPWNQIDASDSYETPRADRIAEYTKRNQANLEWLRRTFEIAEKKNAKAVFISMQANPNFEINRNELARAGFNYFIAELLDLTEAFTRPVVLAHGDSHKYFIDMPRLLPYYHNGDSDLDRKVPNLIRIETFGDRENHWVKVQVNPRDEAVFSFAPKIVKDNL